MTREEAVIILDGFKNNPLFNDTHVQALDMAISALSENKGEWIYDKGICNWRCSRCGETPPPTGYVGKAEFMATHFKFCNYCGADMRKAEKPETCKGCLEPCIMYEPDMRACKK